MKVKRKISQENREFNPEWQIFFFDLINGRIQCLLCSYVCPVAKSFNLNRHYTNEHNSIYGNLTKEARLDIFEGLKRSLISQQEMFTKGKKESEKLLNASLVISHKIAKKLKPYKDGEYIKEVLKIVAEIICPEYTNSFEKICLSPNTVRSRILDISYDLEDQLKEKCLTFDSYSIAIDETTDNRGFTQLAIFIRGIDCNFKIYESLLDLITMEDTVDGETVFNNLINCLTKFRLPLNKLSSFSSDGARYMIGKNKGVVKRLKDKIKEMNIENKTFISIHCLIHQQSLSAKTLDIKSVMDKVTETIKYIRKSSLNQRQFATFLIDSEAEVKEIGYYTQVRWLSRGTVLEKFVKIRKEIVQYLKTKGQDTMLLEDESWISDLCFLTDITNHLNILNTRLQGKGKLINEMFDMINSFSSKLLFLKSQLQSNNLNHFSHLSSEIFIPRIEFYIELIDNLYKDFSFRFNELKENKNKLELFSLPFNAKIENLDLNLQMEIIDLQNDTILKAKYEECDIIKFYSFLPNDIYKELTILAKNIISMFGSTYVCEQFFSKLNIIKSDLRSNLNVDSLKGLMRIAESEDNPRYEKIMKSKSFINTLKY